MLEKSDCSGIPYQRETREEAIRAWKTVKSNFPYLLTSKCRMLVVHLPNGKWACCDEDSIIGDLRRGRFSDCEWEEIPAD